MSATWDSKLGFVNASTQELIPVSEPESVVESAFDAKQVEDLARNSLDFLAALAMPTIFKYFYPDTYQQIWNWLLTYIHRPRDFSQLALGLPRGFAKTTFVKIFLLYVLLFTTRKFILICAANQAKANAILSDVIDFLNESNIKCVFGDWSVGLETDQQILKKFGFRGRNIVIAAGTVATVRGLNIKHERPDVMIFDDIQSREDAESEQISEQLEKDLYGTAMKAKSPHGCLFIFIANMYPTKWSLLKRMKNNPNWVKLIAGGILFDGTSFWEDLQPIAQLLAEFQNDLSAGRPEVFYAEVLNDENASVNRLVDLSKLPQYEFDSSEIPAGKFIIIDPSNDKVNSDAVSVGYFEILATKPVMIEVEEGSMSPHDTITCALKLALRHNCPLIVIESNAYQYSLLYWFNFVCLQMGIEGIQAVDIYSGGLSKPTRIMTMFKELLAGDLWYHPRTAAAVNTQITSFNPMKNNNVDGILDLLAYASKVVAMYGEFIFSHNILEMQEFSGVKVLTAAENSAF